MPFYQPDETVSFYFGIFLHLNWICKSICAANSIVLLTNWPIRIKIYVAAAKSFIIKWLTKFNHIIINQQS